MRALNSMEDFKRDITYRVLLQEDQSILLSGTMRDRFHDIEVTIVVAGESLEITEARVEFRAAPSRYCDQVGPRLEMLHGVVIGKGLSRKVNAALGGADGCGNLRTLLLGLLPLALNIKASEGIKDEKDMLDMIHEKLRGSCVGYPLKDPEEKTSADTDM